VTRRTLLLGGPSTLLLALLLASNISALQPRAPAQWVTAWGTSQHALGGTALSNATVRMVARVTIQGEAVRIRLDNSYGIGPVTIGKAHIGWRRTGATIFPGSNQEVTFKGAPDVTISAGGSVVSDPVRLKVLARQDLAVSLYIPAAGVLPSQHVNTGVTSYTTPNSAGNVTADETGTPFSNTTAAGLWLKSIDVLSSEAMGAVVAFGDSITDGACASRDGYERWSDWLALRLDLERRHIAVVNEGIGGNTLLAKLPEPYRAATATAAAIPNSTTPGLERLDRDALSHSGVTHAILFLGTNDLRRSATADMLREGMLDVIKRVKARGIKILGVTAIPRHNTAPDVTSPWDSVKTKRRNELNEWIRTKAPFDAVLDFDAVVRHAANPDLINPVFDCDGVHPTPRGYYEMGQAVQLDLFARPGLIRSR